MFIAATLSRALLRLEERTDLCIGVRPCPLLRTKPEVRRLACYKHAAPLGHKECCQFRTNLIEFLGS